MQDAYEILGLPPGAGQERIKAAFRELAKRFHPDVNVGNLAAEQRFKEINRAYQSLSDPEARAVHEQRLRRERAGARRRRWQTAATALAASTRAWLLRQGFRMQEATISRPLAGEPARSSTTVGVIARRGVVEVFRRRPAERNGADPPAYLAGLLLPEETAPAGRGTARRGGGIAGRDGRPW